MSGRSNGGGSTRGDGRLERVRQRVVRWRAEHGGPGIPLPEELWAAAVEMARVAGVATVARSLRMDRRRLGARLALAEPAAAPIAETNGFVEIDTSQLYAAPRTIVRMASADGERLEIEFGDTTSLDVGGLARAFWNRRSPRR